MFWVTLAGALFFDIAGMILGKHYLITKTPLFLWLMMAAFLMMGVCVLQVLRFEGVGIMNTIWSAFSISGALIAGMYFFGEKIAPLQWVGISVVVLGIIIIEWPGK